MGSGHTHVLSRIREHSKRKVNKMRFLAVRRKRAFSDRHARASTNLTRTCEIIWHRLHLSHAYCMIFEPSHSVRCWSWGVTDFQCIWSISSMRACLHRWHGFRIAHMGTMFILAFGSQYTCKPCFFFCMFHRCAVGSLCMCVKRCLFRSLCIFKRNVRFDLHTCASAGVRLHLYVCA